MSNEFYTILTNAGLAAVANAASSGKQVNFAQVAVGDGNGSYYTPTRDMTALRNQTWVGPVSSVAVDENNPNWINVEAVIPATDGGFYIREIGILNEANVLLAIGKLPETYKPELESGSTKDLYLKAIFEVTNANVITIKADPSVVLASKKYVDDRVGGFSNNLSTLSNRVTQHLEQKGSTTQSGHVKLSNDTNSVRETDAPTMKALNEVKLYANDIKTKWANVVGSPLVSTDTQAQLESKTQTLKDTFAANLTAKGQTSIGTDTLLNLVSKIANISTGKKFAMGTTTIGANQQNFNYYNGNGSRQSTVLSVSGLGFTPKVVIAFSFASYYINYMDLTVYFDKSYHANFTHSFAFQAKYSGDLESGSTSRYRVNAFASNSFTIPVSNPYGTYIWLALE